VKLDAGAEVDRYVVEEVLGAGGTAMVYLVRHQQLGTAHALKVLTISSSAIKERMLREGRVQATLNHPNVVAVTDVVDIDGAPGLLMERIEGPSLERALGKYKLTMGDAELLFRGILSGVAAAHDRGLVHRDLKPANVLLQRSQQGFVPKVTDFGLAKALAGDPDLAHTRSGIAMGTPSYMAPEQIRDARSVDQRADLWSLGCLLYELTTRRRTFPGDEALAIYNAVTEGRFVPPRKLVPDVPDRIEQAIHGCLRVDRNERIPSCEALFEVLDGARSWPLPEGLEASTSSAPVPRGQSLTSDVPEMAVASLGALPTEEVERVPEAAAASAAKGPGSPPPVGRPEPGLASTGGGLEEVTAEPRPLPPPIDPDAPDQAETVLMSRSQLDGTLAPSDSLDEGEAWGWIPWLLAGGAAVAVALLLLVGFATVVGSVAFTQRAADRRGDEVEAPQPAAPSPVATPAPAPEPIGEKDEPKPEPEPEPKQAPEPRPDPEPSAAPRPQPAPAPAPAPSPAPAPVPSPVEPTPAPSERPPVVTPQPDPMHDRPDPGVIEVRRANAKILSKPFTAQVMIDGKPSGRTPASHDLRLGRHPVILRLGEQEAVFVINVQQAGDNRWCYLFEEQRLVTGPCP